MPPKRGKGPSIQIEKPELPPFLQRIREQIVANEDTERKERAQAKRKDRGTSAASNDEEADPTVVKIGDDDLTEEEYKRIKLALETEYKLDEEDSGKPKHEDLDVDELIRTRQSSATAKATAADLSNKHSPGASDKRPPPANSETKRRNLKTLSYQSSSSDDDD